MVIAGRADRARAAVRLAPQPAQHARRGGRRAGGRRAPGRARGRPLLRAARASASRSAAGRPSSTTATTPTRCRCAPPWTTSRCSSPPDAASRCSATCSSSGRPRREQHREIGAYAAAAGVDVLVAVGPRAARDARARSTARRSPSADAAAAAELADAGWCGRRRRARQGLPRRRARGRGRGARAPPRARLMGEVLIGGTASLLICVFLSPKFIEFLRRREFGQHIREEGPQEHHAKAGTPTMGGLIIFTAIAVPFLLLSDLDAARGRRARRRARVRGARLRRRLHEDRSRSARSACSGRTKLIVTVRDLDRAVARGDAAGGPAGHARPAGRSTPRSTSGSSIRSSSTSWWRGRRRR